MITNYSFLGLMILLLLGISLSIFSMIKDHKYMNYGIPALFIVFFSFFYGLRHASIGTDSIEYIKYYLIGNWSEEYGFYLVLKYVHQLGLSVLQFQVLINIVSGLFLYLAYVKLTDQKKYLAIAVLFLLFMDNLIVGQVSVIRQHLAFSIALFALSLLLEKKHAFFVFWILIATSIHYGAVFMLPFGLLYNRKKWVYALLTLSFIWVIIPSSLLYKMVTIVKFSFLDEFYRTLNYYLNTAGDYNYLKGLSLSLLYIGVIVFAKYYFKTKPSNEKNEHLFYIVLLVLAVSNVLSINGLLGRRFLSMNSYLYPVLFVNYLLMIDRKYMKYLFILGVFLICVLNLYLPAVRHLIFI